MYSGLEEWAFIASRNWLRILLRRELLLPPSSTIVAPLVTFTPPTVVAPIDPLLLTQLTVILALAATVPLAPDPTVTTKPLGAGPVVTASIVTVCEPPLEQVVPLPVLRA